MKRGKGCVKGSSTFLMGREGSLSHGRSKSSPLFTYVRQSSKSIFGLLLHRHLLEELKERLVTLQNTNSKIAQTSTEGTIGRRLESAKDVKTRGGR
jgi:hypothetical protein